MWVRRRRYLKDVWIVIIFVFLDLDDGYNYPSEMLNSGAVTCLQENIFHQKVVTTAPL